MQLIDNPEDMRRESEEQEKDGLQNRENYELAIIHVRGVSQDNRRLDRDH